VVEFIQFVCTCSLMFILGVWFGGSNGRGK
jgi:hypothetical protein